MNTIISIFIILSLLFQANCLKKIDEKKIKQGDEIVQRIESYKTKNGKLPNSLADIGIEEKLEGPYFYEKKNNDIYILWFGSELGESVVYDSTKKKWERR